MDNVVKKNIWQVVSHSGNQKDEYNTRSRIMRTNPSHGDTMFAKYLMTKKAGETREDCYVKAFPKAKSKKYIEFQSRTLFRTARIQKLLNEDVLKGLKIGGITLDYIIEESKKLLNNMDVTKQGNLVVQANTKFEILKLWAKWMGVEQETKQVAELSWFANAQVGDGELKKIGKIGEKQKLTEVKTEVGESK